MWQLGEHDEHGWTVLSKTPDANNDEFDNPEYEEEIYTYFNELGMSKQDREYRVDLLEDWYAAQAIKSRILPENPMTHNKWLTQVNVPGIKSATEARHRHLSHNEIVKPVTQRKEIRLASLRELGRDNRGQPLKKQHQEQVTVIDSIEQDQTQILPQMSSLKRRRDSDSERERQGAHRVACGKDPARDDVLVFEKELKKVGVATSLDYYEGFPLMFWIIPGLAMGETAMRNIITGVKWVISGMP